MMKKSKRRRSKQKRKAWEPLKMKMFEMPPILNEDIPWNERLKIFREIGKKAQQEFDEKYYSIEKWFEEYDQLYLLSFCSMYFLTSPEGIDPEAEGFLEFYPHYLEILQAFALIKERTYSVKPLLDQAEKLKKGMKEIGEITGLRAFAINDDIKTKEDVDRHLFLCSMRSQTTAVRNWAYPSQMKRVTLDLARLVSERFRIIYNLDAVLLMNTLYEIVDMSNKKLNIHFGKIRSFSKKRTPKETIRAYELAFPDIKRIDEDRISKLWKMAGRKLKNLRGFLTSHADLRLHEIQSFTIDEVVSIYGDKSARTALENIFDGWSLQFGELNDINKEYIILGNPVHRKPFIKLKKGVYYTSITGILTHLSLDLLEDLISNDTNFLDGYNKTIKPKYLEDEVERIFLKGFPSAQIFRGSKYPDPDSGDECENDLLVLIDTFAIIVEAKSGNVTDSARRGAPERLTRTLKELIEAPAYQANRFIKFLNDNPQIHKFHDKDGNINEVDSSDIKYYIPVGVTFEDLGFIGSNLRNIINAGIINKRMSELAPSICLTDLESVFTLLPFEAEKVHYLVRRREFEAHVYYDADEIDLLGFYLDNGFNIGAAEYSGDVHINMLLKSKEIDPYFGGLEAGVSVKEPVHAVTTYWELLLKIIGTKRFNNWMETSFILLNTSKEDQEKFLSMVEQLIESIDSGEVENDHNYVVFITGPDERQYLIIGYPYQGLSREKRNDAISNIIDQEFSDGMRGAVCIGIDLDNRDQPYGVLASRLDTNLFVDLDSYGANIN